MVFSLTGSEVSSGRGFTALFFIYTEREKSRHGTWEGYLNVSTSGILGDEIGFIMSLFRASNRFAFSDYSSVSNGVKRGGNISPVLFTIYADYILVRPRSATFAGVIGAFADYLILLSPRSRLPMTC